jgi:hypothetical protein
MKIVGGSNGNSESLHCFWSCNKNATETTGCTYCIIVWLKFWADSDLQIYAHIGLLKKTCGSGRRRRAKGRVMATSQWHPMIEGDGTIVLQLTHKLKLWPSNQFCHFHCGFTGTEIMLQHSKDYCEVLLSANLIYDHHHTHSSYIYP